MVRIHPDPPAIRDADGPVNARVSHSVGAVAQLGERLLCKQEVIGSIPFSSTSEEGASWKRGMNKVHRQAARLTSDL